jgi:hypothetical protein
LLLALSWGTETELSAQRAFVRDLKNSAYLGLGYVANVPNTFVGVSAVMTTPKLLGGAGLYADFKSSASTRSKDATFDPATTPSQATLQYGDELFSDESTYVSANMALVYAITPEFALYGGAGYTHRSLYQYYYDDSETRGEFGWYWVRDPEQSGGQVNFLGGGLFRLGSRFLFQGGVESQPVGATIGFVLTLPVG